MSVTHSMRTEDALHFENLSDLVAAPHGEEMFQLAHAALVQMAKHVPGFAGVAKQAHKFCHGYGIFQYDLQFFKKDPTYFLEQRWRVFDASPQNALKSYGQPWDAWASRASRR